MDDVLKYYVLLYGYCVKYDFPNSTLSILGFTKFAKFLLISLDTTISAKHKFEPATVRLIDSYINIKGFLVKKYSQHL